MVERRKARVPSQGTRTGPASLFRAARNGPKGPRKPLRLSALRSPRKRVSNAEELRKSRAPRAAATNPYAGVRQDGFLNDDRLQLQQTPTPCAGERSGQAPPASPCLASASLGNTTVVADKKTNPFPDCHAAGVVAKSSGVRTHGIAPRDRASRETASCRCHCMPASQRCRVNPCRT